jgi:two-component system response regulator HydG
MERRYIAHVMVATGHDKAEAARILGFDRRTLYRKLEAGSQIASSPPG